MKLYKFVYVLFISVITISSIHSDTWSHNEARTELDRIEANYNQPVDKLNIDENSQLNDYLKISCLKRPSGKSRGKIGACPNMLHLCRDGAGRCVESIVTRLIIRSWRNTNPVLS